MNNADKRLKIAIITCYRQPDYIRALPLRAALGAMDDVELTIIKNSRTNALRYPEVIWKIIQNRFRHNPDVYILTFRGYEMLPIVRLLSLGKPLIFDELVNLIEWTVYEHHKLSGRSAKLLSILYRLLLHSCQVILADTEPHADASSAISRIDRRRYTVVPVSTDETAFRFNQTPIAAANRKFQVFFYGYMLPLHGPQYVLEAAELLKTNPDISFLIAGRIGKYESAIQDAQSRGARIEYRHWVPFAELPALIASSAVNIAGPFGGTYQSQLVINGKVFQFLATGSVALIGESKATGLFRNHENCLLVPQGNAAAIAAEINWAYHNQDKLPTIAAAGRQLYDQAYSNKIIAENLRQVLQRVA